MAVPTEQRGITGSRPPVPRAIARLQKIGAALGRPLFAVVLAIVAGGVVILLTTPGSLESRFAAAFSAYQYLYLGSFGDVQSLSYTLIKVGALILTGLSVAIAARVGLFNIGAEGQLAVGAMTAGIIAFKLPAAPGWLLIPLLIVSSALAGAIWGGIVGLLKAWRGAHEVVTTIMLNWIAFHVADYFINGPFKAPQQANQTPSIPLQATLPSIAMFYNNTLGHIFPPIPQPEQYLVDVSFFFALIALVVYWFITRRTTFGYEIRVIGQNPRAARYAGIPIGRNLVLAMALAGAFAGLAGAFRLMGQFPYQLIATTFSTDSTGFDAIGVALLGRTTATGVLLGSLLFGGLRQGSTQMQISANIPVDLIFILQALVLFSIAAKFLPAIQRALPSWIPFSRKAPLVAGSIGAGETAAPLNGAVNNDNGSGNGVSKGIPGTSAKLGTGEDHSEQGEGK
ncbi:MAG: ABC transporter permease [Ktedonobacteraceae bacterium]|nr:ABC transporter permease [Ktedonobacteraceae bacterium]